MRLSAREVPLQAAMAASARNNTPVRPGLTAGAAGRGWGERILAAGRARGHACRPQRWIRNHRQSGVADPDRSGPPAPPPGNPSGSPFTEWGREAKI
jgi:hypothetical protein